MGEGRRAPVLRLLIRVHGPALEEDPPQYWTSNPPNRGIAAYAAFAAVFFATDFFQFNSVIGLHADQSVHFGTDVVDWRRFVPSDFEYDFERDKLAEHGVILDEAVECFFSDFQVRRNKKYTDRYQLLGKTLGGRKLKIIFQLKAHNVVRIITGWPL